MSFNDMATDISEVLLCAEHPVDGADSGGHLWVIHDIERKADKQRTRLGSPDRVALGLGP